MKTRSTPRSSNRSKTSNDTADGKPRKRVLNRILERKLHEEVSYEEYREKVRDVYNGPKGKLLTTASKLSLHLPLGERIFKRGHFDLDGAQSILDVGCGAGQLVQHLLKYSDPDATITCTDISEGILQRARRRLKSDRPDFAIADLARLPFADASFDCVTCGYVLEHLPDARVGLAELSRVMQPGARMLLFTSEESFGGAWTSRFWCCRTYNRQELIETAAGEGLVWQKELWFSPVHKLFRAGGICGVLVKQ